MKFPSLTIHRSDRLRQIRTYYCWKQTIITHTLKKYQMPNQYWPHDRIIAAILSDQSETVSERLLSINNEDRSDLERFFKRVLMIIVGGGHKDLAVAVFHPLKQEKGQPLEE